MIDVLIFFDIVKFGILRTNFSRLFYKESRYNLESEICSKYRGLFVGAIHESPLHMFEFRRNFEHIFDSLLKQALRCRACKNNPQWMKMDLLEELKKLSLKLDQAGIDYALCGGLAIAIYAKPRATLDIDIMISPDFLLETRKAAQEQGFTLSSAPIEFKDGAVKIHRLTKIDKDSGEHLFLDLLIVTPETKKAWDDHLTIEWEGIPLKVVSPQGLIFLKSLRNSGQDQDDIEYLRSLENED